MLKRYKIQFPQFIADNLDQDEAFFYLITDSGKHKIKFHDYAEIYNNPGLYEQLFYDRLKCCSPQKVTDSLKYTVDQNNEYFSQLRVLDFGAGNGMMGEAMKKYGIARLVGVDIIPEAKEATNRDRPGLYDEYYVKDFTNLTESDEEEVRSWHLNSLMSIAALGYNDIPPEAFIKALNIISPQGWVAFNIKESFLSHSDKTGFSSTIRELIASDYLNINHIERYRHRISIEGDPLFYFTVICWKNRDIPDSFLSAINE